MGDRGATATLASASRCNRRVYRMGDRGATATDSTAATTCAEFTGWEIGGQPQRKRPAMPAPSSLPDGRSGGNRNSVLRRKTIAQSLPDGRSGGNRNSSHARHRTRGSLPDGRSGGNRNENSADVMLATSLPDGRSGGNRNVSVDGEFYEFSLPDGRSGGNRNSVNRGLSCLVSLPDGRSGGNRNLGKGGTHTRRVYRMGDRGATATGDHKCRTSIQFTGWEIGGQPQRLHVMSGWESP